jgi:hypothetical protein
VWLLPRLAALAPITPVANLEPVQWRNYSETRFLHNADQIEKLDSGGRYCFVEGGGDNP